MANRKSKADAQEACRSKRERSPAQEGFRDAISEHGRRFWLGEVRKKTAVANGVNVKEYQTLLKLVIGMATGAYGYNPKALRSVTVPQIKKHLEVIGLDLDDETIRDRLKEAAKSLPSGK